MTLLLELIDVHKRYASGRTDVAALSGVSLRVRAGELCAIEGPSGSGKSTLLNIIGLLDVPTAGEVRLDGQDLGRASAEARADIRNSKLGFIFQAFHLLPRLTAWENVALPLFYRREPRDRRRTKALAALAQVGLAHRADHRPDELSGGERQRVAIARGLVAEPSLILADEPTGNLDSATATEIMDELVRLNRELGVTVVLVTHQADLAACCPRRIRLFDGRVAADDHDRPASVRAAR